MTISDPIEAAIAAGVDAYLEVYNTIGGAHRIAVDAAIRAAEPILKAAGREEAAASGETCACPCNGNYWDGEN